MVRLLLEEESKAVRMVARRLGLREVAPALLKAAHHTSFLLPSIGAVARVQSAEPTKMALSRAAREIAVARHLASRDVPTIAPLAPDLAGPHIAGAAIITFWRFLDQARAAGQADAPRAAHALAAFHAGLRHFGAMLPPFTDALARCRAVLADDRACGALSGDERDLLAHHHDRLRRAIEAASAERVPLHGDAHLGNFLLTPPGPLWIDLEDACLGPREYDIAALPAETWPLFDKTDQTLVRRCADLRSVCVAIWCWADPSRSEEVREAAEHHLDLVRRIP